MSLTTLVATDPGTLRIKATTKALLRRTSYSFRIASLLSSIPRQFPPTPMMVFAIGIEHALDVAVQRSHDADAREHRRAARDQDQGFHSGLPLRRLTGARGRR